MNVIDAAHVRQLLDAGTDNPSLVVSEGQVLVVPDDDIKAGTYRGALVVIDRKGLADTATNVDLDSPSDAELTAIAERLNAAVANLGG